MIQINGVELEYLDQCDEYGKNLILDFRVHTPQTEKQLLNLLVGRFYRSRKIVDIHFINLRSERKVIGIEVKKP